MADIFLYSGEVLTGSPFSNSRYFGNTGDEAVGFVEGVTATVVSQTVEQVSLAGASSDYLYQQQGNQLLIYSGTTLVTTVTLQNDANGTIIGFANGTTSAQVGAGGMTLGGTLVPSDAPAAVTPGNIEPGNGGTAGETYTLTTDPDEIDAGAGNDTIRALTVNAAGADATTLSAFDDIDGGTGTDTLNIYVDANSNNGFPTTATVQNVEIVNLFNEVVPSATMVNVANYGAALQQFWQVANAAIVTDLTNSVTAGFRNIDADVTVRTAVSATTANIALDGYVEDNMINVDMDAAGSTANSVVVTGTVMDGVDANTTAGPVTLDIDLASGVQSVNVSTAVAANLVVANAGGAVLRAVDASASTGAVTYTGATSVSAIRTGSAGDTVTLDTTTDSASEVSALVETNAGNDTITVSADGNAATTVNAGVGDDTVNITTRSSGVLTVALGDGSDIFSSAVDIKGTDSIDAGAGQDTLLLNLVGSANVGAFSNFDVYDVRGLDANLDLNILDTNNDVDEIVASGALDASATLENVDAGVNFRALADMGLFNTLTLDQQTAGPITFTLDADEAGPADTIIDAASMSVATTNATSVNVVFDADYLASITGETPVGDNVSTVYLDTNGASSVTVVSGGDNSENVLDLLDNATTGAGLTSITVTGTQLLDLIVTEAVGGTAALANVDASASTGGLVFDLADLANDGSVTLGSGTDLIYADSDSGTAAGTFETIIGFEKASATVLNPTAPGFDEAVDEADKLELSFASGADETVATDNVVAGGVVEDGVLVFSGAGPATLTGAISIADTAADAEGEVLAFEYLGDTFVFVQGAAAADTLVQLDGVTGLNLVGEATTANAFYFA